MKLMTRLLPENLGIRTKVAVLMSMTVAIALLLSTSGLLMQQFHSEREASTRRHEQIARVISANIGAALVFNDRDAAMENLATARGIEDIGWLAVFKDGKEPFAAYHSTAETGALREVRFPVVVDGATFGELRMGVHYLSFAEILSRTAVAALVSFAGSLVIALAFGRWFSRAAFRPVAAIVAAMRRFVSSGDYSFRLEPGLDPESALITSSFNAMLDEVEARNGALSQTAAELREARDEAEQASVAKSQFLANMSHELRTPLNAIIGYTEVLQEELEAAALDRSVEDVNWIHSSARQLLELINGILDLSKIEAGRMQIDRHEFDVAELLREVGAMLDPLAAQKRNTLHIQLDPSLRTATSDATKLRQCLLNLGSNACKFTQDGHVFVHGRAEGGELVFTVSDTGIGMSQEELDRLFQPFVQADASTTRRYGGTGLGLTITWRFAEMLGGRVDVESVPAQGSTFTLRIRADLEDPAALVHEGAVLPHGEARAPALDQARENDATRSRPLALIIEDEPSSLQLLTRLVEQAGYDCLAAGDGDEGLAIARSCRPDLLLLDIALPTVDGWAVLKALEDDPQLKGIPAVVVTVDDDHKRVFSAGAAEHLVKPIDRSELSAVLLQYSGRSIGAVLIVEDDPATARLWTRGVTQMGYTAHAVHNGQDALAALSAGEFDFVVTDLRMPQINGFELVAAIAKMPPERRPHIIVATGKVLDESEERFFEGKILKLLPKRGLSPRKLAESLAGPHHPSSPTAPAIKGPIA